ncbi:hypothetical protein FF021_12835 [Leptospira noguchii]|nr:hypothetical protein FF021_12835 [Leptospira noguchii]
MKNESPSISVLWKRSIEVVVLIYTMEFFNNSITHNYIIKYLIFCMESVFCDKINGTQFFRDQ